MFPGMANSAKDKGDRFEREAVPVLVELLPEFAVTKPMRMLGAGRKDDVGDLHVLADAAVQVKAWDNMGGAIRTAVSGSVIQAGHGDKEYALGMVPVQGARVHQVHWLACVAPGRWPVPVEPVAEFGMVSKALAWVKDDEGPYGYRVWDRQSRAGHLIRAHSPLQPHRHGVLPLQFSPGESAESLGLTGEEVYAITGLAGAAESPKQVRVRGRTGRKIPGHLSGSADRYARGSGVFPKRRNPAVRPTQAHGGLGPRRFEGMK